MSVSTGSQPTVPKIQINYIELSNIKHLESAELQISGHRHILHRKDKTLRAEFIDLTLHEQCCLRISYKKQFIGLRKKRSDEYVTLNLREILSAANEKEFVQIHNKTRIVLGITIHGQTDSRGGVLPTGNEQLQPTTGEILERCPRFRILVIGKTGVGKSSLIQHAFGVEGDLVSHDRPGDAHIDEAFISPRNERFVLHDSKGFEPGEGGNLSTVKEFIQRRRQMRDLKDQLHAVWLCFEIPWADGRLLEAGVEEFLRSKNDILRDIPLVLLFTKYDMLVERVCDDMEKEHDSKVMDDSDVKLQVESKLDALCIKPIEELTGRRDIPYIPVSNEEGYENSLVKLVELTYKHVSKHVAEEASVVTAMAQRVDPKSKIVESIAVGKKRYWKALAASPNFEGHTMWDCFHVIHTDIVTIWNFHDTSGHLKSNEFRALIVNMVGDVQTRTITNPVKILMGGGSFIVAIAAAVGALAGPAAPIVVPIAACAVVAVWAYEVYEQSRVVQQRFMAYIVDLTHVMEILLIILAGNNHSPLTRRAIKLAFNSYYNSPIRAKVHDKIQNYRGSGISRGRDAILEMIESMMKPIPNDTTNLFQNRTLDVNLDQDEDW
ncbi:uncharacterized protein FIBRA_03034 [Fibroporia radiculosa]|uniref:G domain-containing protein n=1 Tax=Fibroporia radiculosa TaxID=599839 RepID=J4I9D8_9APHY|nr:uncharacterized protein FIBRA_03034 [Fibroporia radiculosa]CCM00986.1 predicted protein [Fibroporia radiculosa]